jgi:hypothetical protein
LATSNKAGQLLTSLADANGYVELAVTLGEEIVPLGKWAISEIRSINAGVETISYQAVVAADQAEDALTKQLAGADLTAINAELLRLGKPLLAT